MVPSLSDTAELIRSNPNHLVWGYVRVSDERQVEGYSLEGQCQAIQDYCLKQGLSEPLLVVEEASSRNPLFLPSFDRREGATVSTRPKMMLLLGHLTKLSRAHLVVFGLDRLARNMGDQETILRLMWDTDNSVHSTLPTEQELLAEGAQADPQRVLFRQILASFKQYESHLIEMRMRTGAMVKGSKGGYTGGRPPFGYSIMNGELVIEPMEAYVVRVVVYLSVHCSWSLRRIATHLNENNPTAGKSKFNHVKVKRIIDRLPLYMGRYTNSFGDEHARKDLILIPDDPHELFGLIKEGPPNDTDKPTGPGDSPGDPEIPTGRDASDGGGGYEGGRSTEAAGLEQGVDGGGDQRVVGAE